MLALSAGAQYPPPYVHNYWSTQAQAQVNSPIMNSSHEVTNFVNNGQTLSSIMIFGLGNLAAESGKVAINDDGSGNFANNTFRWTAGGAVTATSFTGDGSGLTGLPSGGTGIATNGGSGLNNWMTNLLAKNFTNVGPVMVFTDPAAPLNPTFITNINSQFAIGQIGNYADLTLRNLTARGNVLIPGGLGGFGGDGSSITALNASSISSGTVPAANAPSGSVIQCLVSNYTATLLGTNVAPIWSNIVVIAFTPKLSTSRVVVEGSAMVGAANSFAMFMRVAKNRAAMTVGDSAGSRISCNWYGQSAGAGFCATAAGTSIESPGSTTTVEYSLQLATESTGTYYVNRNVTDTATAVFGRGTSSLKITEYAP